MPTAGQEGKENNPALYEVRVELWGKEPQDLRESDEHKFYMSKRKNNRFYFDIFKMY